MAKDNTGGVTLHSITYLSPKSQNNVVDVKHMGILLLRPTF